MQPAIRQGYSVGSIRWLGIEGADLRLDKRIVTGSRVGLTPLHARVLPTNVQHTAVYHAARWLIHPRERTVERGPDSANVIDND